MKESISEKISQLEEKYKLLADKLIDAIWVVDADSMTYDYITPTVERISGYSQNELIGMPVKKRMPASSYKKIVEMLSESTRQMEEGLEPVRCLEIEMIHKHGQPYWIEFRARFMKNKNRSLKIIGVARDITHQKIHEQDQKKLIQKLNESLAEKEKLLNEIRMLREILPICCGCKRIRDEEQRWWPLDIYVHQHTKTKLSHTICPDCKAVMYKDVLTN